MLLVTAERHEAAELPRTASMPRATTTMKAPRVAAAMQPHPMRYAIAGSYALLMPCSNATIQIVILIALGTCISIRNRSCTETPTCRSAPLPANHLCTCFVVYDTPSHCRKSPRSLSSCGYSMAVYTKYSLMRLIDEFAPA